MTDEPKPTQPLRTALGDPSGVATSPIHHSDAPTSPFGRTGEQPAGEQRVADIWRTVPGYEITSILGRGGMGVVYKARQIRADRTVALKMVLAGRLAGDEELDRFRAEALAAAALDYPGIVPIYEVGEHEGQPFFSMGYVEGPTLAARLAEGPLAPHEAAAIVREIAAAVEYAHSRGVVHRDLKPGNVLLKQRRGAKIDNDATESAGVGQSLRDFQPVVTDFGLAKRVGIDSAARTVTGQVLGTPSFMPPEQAQGRVDDVGPRADVYALGALLYVCLVGRPPFQSGSVMETLRQVVEQEPVRPRDLDAGIPLDLETVALKCLEKEPARRYATARDVAEELRRYLAGEPITARPIGRLARAWRWCKRKPAIASAAAIAIVATVATIVVLAVAVTLVKESENRAVQLGERNATLAKDERAAKEQAQTAAGEVTRKNVELRRQLRIAQSTRLTAESGNVAAEYPVRSVLFAREAVLATAADEYPVRAAAETALRDALARLPGWAVFNDRFHMTMNPDGRWLAVAADGGAVRVCDLTAAINRPDFRMLHGHEKEIFALKFTLDSQRLVTVSFDKTARVWDMSAEDPEASCRVLRGHTNTVTCLSLSADGRWLATGSKDGTARIWDLAAPDPSAAVRVLRKQLGQVQTVTLSGDAHWLATEGYDRVGRLWDLTAADPDATARFLGHDKELALNVADADGRWLVTGIQSGSPEKNEYLLLYDLHAADPLATRRALAGQKKPIIHLAITPNGRWLVTGGAVDATARVWDLDTADPAASVRVLTGHKANINWVAISPGARWVATGSSDHSARMYDLAAVNPNEAAQIIRGHDAEIWEVELSPDGQRLITNGGDSTIRAWGPGVRGPLDATPLALRGHGGSINGPQFSPDGRWLITSGNFMVLCCDLAAPDPTRAVGVLHGSAGEEHLPFAVLPDGSGLATGDDNGTLRLWDLTKPGPDPAVRAFAGHGVQINRVAITSDGRWLITFSNSNRTIKVWDLKSADPAGSVRILPDNEVTSTLATSPDGRWLATVSGRTAKLWDLQAAGPLVAVREFSGHTENIFGIGIDAENRWLATGGLDKTVRLWDLRSSTSTAPRVLKRQQSSSWELAISPDGHWLVSGGDKTAVVWDLRKEDPDETAQVLRGHSDSVRSLAFSPDGRWLVTGSWDKTLRVWDLHAAELSATSRVLRGPQDGINDVAVSPDGRWIAASDRSGIVWLWPLTVQRLLDVLPQVAGRDLTPDERAEFQLDLPALAGDVDSADVAQTAAASGQPTNEPSHAAGGGAVAPPINWHVPADGEQDVRVWVRLNQGTSALNADTQDQIDTVRLNGAAIGDEDLKRFAVLTRLRQLVLVGTPITDAGLEHLRDLPELELLFIGGTQVRGPGLAGLSRLPKLQGLGIGGSLIDDASLEHLPALPELYWLELVDAHVTDAGLAHLEKYPRLQILDLSGCPVTDASIDRLTRLGGGAGGLSQLNLERTAVTPAGAEKLRKALPNCQVKLSSN